MSKSAAVELAALNRSLQGGFAEETTHVNNSASLEFEKFLDLLTFYMDNSEDKVDRQERRLAKGMQLIQQANRTLRFSAATYCNFFKWHCS